jgi:hypothetical protein
MASISTPFPLTSSAASSVSAKTHSAAVQNDSNQVVLTVDGEGISIHNVPTIFMTPLTLNRLPQTELYQHIAQVQMLNSCVHPFVFERRLRLPVRGLHMKKKGI